NVLLRIVLMQHLRCVVKDRRARKCDHHEREDAAERKSEDRACDDKPECGKTIAFDGRYVAFWGAWGTDMMHVKMFCPEDGNRVLLAYCNGVDPKRMYDEEADGWYQLNLVPENQGIFV